MFKRLSAICNAKTNNLADLAEVAAPGDAGFFDGADLSGADLRGTDMARFHFNGTRFAGAYTDTATILPSRDINRSNIGSSEFNQEEYDLSRKMFRLHLHQIEENMDVLILKLKNRALNKRKDSKTSKRTADTLVSMEKMLNVFITKQFPSKENMDAMIINEFINNIYVLVGLLFEVDHMYKQSYFKKIIRTSFGTDTFSNNLIEITIPRGEWQTLLEQYRKATTQRRRGRSSMNVIDVVSIIFFNAIIVYELIKEISSFTNDRDEIANILLYVENMALSIRLDAGDTGHRYVTTGMPTNSGERAT